MVNIDGKKRVIIERLEPQINNGTFSIKRVVGEKVIVTADIFTDGHDLISAELLYRHKSSSDWRYSPMTAVVNDEWTGSFEVRELGIYFYTVCGWVDYFSTWLVDFTKKFENGQEITVDLRIGMQHLQKMLEMAGEEDKAKIRYLTDMLNNPVDIKEIITILSGKEVKEMVAKYHDEAKVSQYPSELKVSVSRAKAAFSSWYEFFPRSFRTFGQCEKFLPEIQKMGFDVVYLPPIHPIGMTKRKGKNNSVVSLPEDPGSPWAIGSKEGGHKAIHPDLGTFEDFQNFIKAAERHNIEIAIDLAFQCSPDHPYEKQHPQWFKWRPDNTVQFAENPPKKYEDIIPLNFESDEWQNLWQELKSIVVFWIEKGIKIFRVDNPHTKPFVFWQWLISEIKNQFPDVIFLSEAFTKPKPMQRLAKLDFDQSYTYFTWRNTKYELEQYMTELTATELAEYMRPNFWPNTPDILPEYLQYGGRAAFIIRLVLAATLSSNYGIYGPAYELCINQAIENKEEYYNAEKYEIKKWDINQPGNIKALIERVNKCRNENPALQSTRNLKILKINNDAIISFCKATEDLSNVLIVLVNLDPYHRQSGVLQLPIHELGIEQTKPYLLHDLLSSDKYIWQGELNYIELDPQLAPAHILRLHKHLRRETDFDYFI
ncbi:MAG TPA: alpha-1,4-glucan--maltose-1-phosphate maltosyltransferase [Phycisphaerales bacterium]|nr:alpha-1,4-glucan--maltose-1-phosphate maltosyltransferase [Phycisphaerales bacterium]